MKTLTEEEALNKIATLCSSSEYCINDVTEKLRKWQMASGTISCIIKKLVENKFIDEERYAKAFVRDKYRFNKWGVVKICQALRLKDIPEKVINPAIEEIDRKEYLDNLKTLLHSKEKTIQAKNEYERWAKLTKFALSRGFEMKDIQIIIGKTNDFKSSFD